MAHPFVVSTQYAQGGGADADRFNAGIDASGFQVNDFIVIALMTLVSGGGNNWFNTFAGAPATHNPHLSGPFGDSTDIFGHIDANMQSGPLGACSIFRHKIVANDLVDTAGGTGALSTIGWQRSSTSGAYGTAFVAWQIRNVTFSSKSGTGAMDAAPISPDPHTLSLALSAMTKYQAFFSLAVSHGNGYTPPATFAHTAVDNGAAPSFNPHVFAQLDWQYAGASQNTGMRVCVNDSFGKLADASAFAATLGASGDTSANADSVAVIVTFVEDITPLPGAGGSFESVPFLGRMRNKDLPYTVNRGLLR